MKDYNNTCMTHSEQLKLNNILSQIEPHHTLTLKKNSSLLMLSDDCLLNIMKFITDYKTKIIFQYCCRTLLILSRKPLIWHNKAHLISIGAYKHNIASLILSENINNNINAIKEINNTISITRLKSEITNKYYNVSELKKIFMCNRNIESQLAMIINNNISNKNCQTCALKLMHYNDFIYKIFPSLNYIIHSTHLQKGSKILTFVYDKIQTDECFLFNIMDAKNSLFLESIVNLDISSDIGDVKLIKKISSFGYISHIKTLLHIIVKSKAKPCYFSAVINEIPKHSTRQSVDMMNDSSLINYFFYFQYNKQILIDILNIANHNQRVRIIKTILGKLIKSRHPWDICSILNVIPKDCAQQTVDYMMNDSLLNYYIKRKQILSDILNIANHSQRVRIIQTMLGKLIKSKANPYYICSILDVIPKDCAQQTVDYMINNLSLRNYLHVYDAKSNSFTIADYNRFMRFDDIKKEWTVKLAQNVIINILNVAEHNQRMNIIKKGWTMKLTQNDMEGKDSLINDKTFITAHENYVKRWNIMNKHLQMIGYTNEFINKFETCVYDNEYNFEEILKDINSYECKESVIISSIKTQSNWNNLQCDKFYCILKLILIMEIFDFNDEQFVKYAFDIINKCYGNFSNVTNFNIIGKLIAAIDKKSINNNITHRIVDSLINHSSLTSMFQIGDTLEAKYKSGIWCKSQIVEINGMKNSIKIHYFGFNSCSDEWFDLNCGRDHNRLKMVNREQMIFNIASHDQIIKIIRNNQYIYLTDIENYLKKWNIMKKYLQMVYSNQFIDTFEICLYNNKYNFEEIFKDINNYEYNKSVIMSSMIKQCKLNKKESDKFYCVLKLVLVTAIFNFNNKYIVKCVLDMANKCYGKKSFDIMLKLTKMINKKISNKKTCQSIKMLFGELNKNDNRGLNTLEKSLLNLFSND